MGNSASFLPDNVEVEHESGSSRFFGSICAAVCLAPLLILAMTFLIGFNEQQAVCTSKAYLAASETAKEVQCSNANEGNGELVFFNCDLKEESAKAPSIPLGWVVKAGAIGISIKPQMYQCIEEVQTEKTKDKGGGGGVTKTKTYTYHKAWVDYQVDSSKFHSVSEANRACGAMNPEWSSVGLPKKMELFTDTAKAGPYTLQSNLLQKVELDTVVDMKAPAGWIRSGNGFARGTGAQIGDSRVVFYGNNWQMPTVTVVGQNIDGVITEWKAPASWLCDGSWVSTLRTGKKSMVNLFEQMHDEANATKWALRLVGFLVLWFAFSLCFAPLEVMADCIPCIGPCLGDSIEAIACCISCLPATGCFLIVAGLVWLAMRPLIAIPVLSVAVLIMCVTGYQVQKNRKLPKDGVPLKPGDPIGYGTASPPQVLMAPYQIQPQPVAVAQAAAARQMQVMVPANVAPGSLVQVQSPEGVALQVAVPAGLAPGAVFTVSY